MALQGDGNGIVTIPQATASGDFSIVFSALTLSSTVGIVIGDNATSDNYIFNNNADITTKMGGTSLSPYTSGAAGQVVKFEVVRIGGNVQVIVDDVVISNNSVATTFTLNTIFAYSGSSLVGANLLSGTLSMVGFGAGDRSYNFEGSGSTLIDTISGENGILSGFTTGGFTGAPKSITIDSVSDFESIQRDGSGQAVFTISGGCSTTNAVEYSYDETTWFTLDPSPTTTYSGAVTVTGQQSVTVRLADDTGIKAKVNHLTAAMVVACWWQSNMAGRLTNNQSITVTGNNPIPVMYKNGSFLEMEDPTGIDGSATGSLLPLLAKKYSDIGIPVCFANVAQGSSSIDYWNGNGATGYGRIQDVFDNVGLEFTLSIGGETDTANGMSQAEMETKLGNTVDSIFSDFGVQHYLVTFPFGNTTTGNPADMNAAFANVVANNINCLFAGNLQVIDIDTGTTAGNDGTHIKSDADAVTASNIIYSAVNSVFSTINMINTDAPDGSYNMKIWDLSTDLLITEMSVDFSGGSASPLIPVTVGTSVLAFTAGSNPPTTGMAYDGVTE